MCPTHDAQRQPTGARAGAFKPGRRGYEAVFACFFLAAVACGTPKTAADDTTVGDQPDSAQDSAESAFDADGQSGSDAAGPDSVSANDATADASVAPVGDADATPDADDAPGTDVVAGQDGSDAASEADGETDSAEVTGPVCTCGDGICSTPCGETQTTCPADCKGCGNGVCEPGEGPTSCKIDCCGSCGDGKCKGYDCGESPQACPVDCANACGNHVCDKGESPATCAEDCVWQVCGNGVCEASDGGPAQCPKDCAASCGNGICLSVCFRQRAARPEVVCEFACLTRDALVDSRNVVTQRHRRRVKQFQQVQPTPVDVSGSQ